MRSAIRHKPIGVMYILTADVAFDQGVALVRIEALALPFNEACTPTSQSSLEKMPERQRL